MDAFSSLTERSSQWTWASLMADKFLFSPPINCPSHLYLSCQTQVHGLQQVKMQVSVTQLLRRFLCPAIFVQYWPLEQKAGELKQGKEGNSDQTDWKGVRIKSLSFQVCPNALLPCSCGALLFYGSSCCCLRFCCGALTKLGQKHCCEHCCDCR